MSTGVAWITFSTIGLFKGLDTSVAGPVSFTGVFGGVPKFWLASVASRTTS